MEKEKESDNKKYSCYMGGLRPHIYKDGKCVNCGLIDRDSLDNELTQSQAKDIANRLGFKVRDPNEKLTIDGEITLPPHLQAVWDFAVDYANKWDMIERGVYKPTLVELDQMEADKIKLRVDNDGNIIKVTPIEEEEK